MFRTSSLSIVRAYDCIAGNMALEQQKSPSPSNMSPVSTPTTATTTTTKTPAPTTPTASASVKPTRIEIPTKTAPTTTTLPNINLFKRPMNTLQKQWYRVLIARRVGFGSPRPADDSKEQSYQSVCQQRYKAAFRRYNEQFLKEIRQLEAMQPSAIDAMRVHRSFAITTLWLPLHSRREINLTLEKLEKVLSVKERRRVEEILKYGPGAKRF